MSTEEELREAIALLNQETGYMHSYHVRSIKTIIAALEKAQADKAYATHLIREAMRSGVNGSDHYSANWASDTGGFMRMYLARIDQNKKTQHDPQ